MSRQSKRLDDLVDKLLHDSAATVVVAQGIRLTPSTLDRLRFVFEKSLESAVAGDRWDDEDTEPGLPHSIHKK